MLFHFRPAFETLIPAWKSMRSFTQTGGTGVELFFILSGVILCYRYENSFKTVERREYWRFLIYRLGRIYPVHLAAIGVVAVGLVVARAAGIHINGNYSVVSLIGMLLLVVAWSPNGAGDSWNFPAWSISAEWFAYLLFPFAAVATARIRSQRVAAFGLAVSFAAYVLFISVLGWAWPLVRIATLFMLGVFIAHVVRTPLRPPWPNRLAVAAVAVIAVAVVAVDGRPHGALLIVGFALLIYALAQEPGVVGRRLAGPRIVFLGEVSYALYMTHGIVQMFGTKALRYEDHAHAALPVRLGIVAVYLALVAIAAGAMYFVVERPGRRYVRRLGDRIVDGPAPNTVGR